MHVLLYTRLQAVYDNTATVVYDKANDEPMCVNYMYPYQFSRLDSNLCTATVVYYMYMYAYYAKMILGDHIEPLT